MLILSSTSLIKLDGQETRNLNFMPINLKIASLEE